MLLARAVVVRVAVMVTEVVRAVVKVHRDMIADRIRADAVNMAIVRVVRVMDVMDRVQAVENIVTVRAVRDMDAAVKDRVWVKDKVWVKVRVVV
jgi:hypothetical protein